ncbi:hypothetical protein D9611_009540 [Ephemerocybe angulata]|uniref:F-box domain-containing protein n=1 Tax=Ephemerocybe angulata TaxID=980116 RepID=A0A8H5AVB1_9AGAR|nr:hypothetical protein D9611_009540 [Tulosesus angulatus]
MDIDHDLSRIFLSNELPTPTETASIQLEVDAIMSNMSFLQAQLQELEERLRVRRGALSSVRRVPPEILAEIFSNLVTEDLDSEGRDTVLDLGLVCKSWRRATLGSHRLWAGISVNQDQCNETSYGRIITWLNRSGALPKTFKFDSLDPDYCDRGEPCQMSSPTLINLLSLGPKLHKLILQCSSHECFRTFLEELGPKPDLMNPRPWDTLQSLELELTTEDPYPWDEPLEASSSMFHHLPQLENLDLHLPLSCTAFEINPTEARFVDINIPPRLLQGLKAFTIHYDWEGSHILAMLEHCKNLESLTIDLRGGNVNWYDGNDILVRKFTELRLLLPKVQTIRLESASNIEMLDLLRAPSLQDLHFEMESGYEDPSEIDFQEPLLRFITASNCQKTLRSLHLRKLVVSATELARTFFKLPSLTGITLDRCRFEESLFWRQMKYFAIRSAGRRGSSDDSLCLPHLQELQTLCIPVEGPLLSAVAKFLKVNREINPLPCSWKVSYRTVMKAEVAVRRDLADLRHDGVSFHVLPSQSFWD